tara:strand:+ start:410 stop:706 length:297 start_codon:yes stop_codon:yes gene_type:complete
MNVSYKEEELEHTSNIVRLATQNNEHTLALELIADYVRNKHKGIEGVGCLVQSVRAIYTLHDFYKCLPTELASIRFDIQNAIFSFLDEEETKTFKKAL